MNTQVGARLADEINLAYVESILVERYDCLAEPPVAEVWTIYDTFDWRLFSQDLTLFWSGNTLICQSLKGEKTLPPLPMSSPPRFVGNLPEVELKQKLGAIIEMRALIELTQVCTRSYTYRILNKDQKTVVRLEYLEASLDASDESRPAATYLAVRPLRGYDKNAAQLVKYLQSNLDFLEADEGIFYWALQASGHSPGAYSSKLDVQLQPHMRAGSAAKAILKRLLETMQANEAGIVADIDTEFLHDYRIAVRRTRSALSLIRKVFSDEKTNYFKSKFKELGNLTNELRDLDVYLLAENDYRALLPDAMQDDISPLFDALRVMRSKAIANVVAGFQSTTYTQLLDEWDAFLQEPVKKSDAANTAMPIGKLSRQRLKRQYQVVIEDGETILSHTDDELLHVLRIECKKLRYLLEFFASLYPPKQVSSMIKQLKKLQDNLGEFTDLLVQQNFLLSVAENLEIDEVQAKRALVATGYLVETLERKRQAVRADLARTYKRFASPAHQKHFRKVFIKGKKGKS